MPSVACTVTAGSAVGSTCRVSVRHVLAPSARAATTYSNSRARSTCPRTSRAYPTQPITVSARTTLPRLGPSTATSAMASSKPGKRQQDVHHAADRLVDAAAVVAGDRAHRHADRRPRRRRRRSRRTARRARPMSTRERMSRPSSSRPNQWLRARPFEPQRQVPATAGSNGDQPRRQQRRRDDHDDDDRADADHAATPSGDAHQSDASTHNGSADRGRRRPDR